MRTSVLAAATVAMALAAMQAPADLPSAAPTGPPRVEIAFVLDTTGSMSGLIAAAKAKIWFIANQVVLGKPKPIVKVGLVPYRDKGDAYVTKVYDLTDNIDRVYTDLMGFRAGGGGDGPENVNQGLHDAVHKLAWSKDRKTLKIIYLVGDFPPHNEYKDVPTYDKIAKAAIEKGIYVNTILCGSNAEARKVWQDIARRTEGEFMAIAQDGGVREIATPFDADLAKLNGELTRTVVVYGDASVQAGNRALNEEAGRYDKKAQAARVMYALSSGRAAGGDLVDAVRNGKVDLEKVKTEHLPANMQKMSPRERQAYVSARQQKRDEIMKEVKELSARRAAFMKTELAKVKGPKAGFDHEVVKSLRKQAARKDITYTE